MLAAAVAPRSPPACVCAKVKEKRRAKVRGEPPPAVALDILLAAEKTYLALRGKQIPQIHPNTYSGQMWPMIQVSRGLSRGLLRGGLLTLPTSCASNPAAVARVPSSSGLFVGGLAPRRPSSSFSHHMHDGYASAAHGSRPSWHATTILSVRKGATLHLLTRARRYRGSILNFIRLFDLFLRQ